jgi:hypothetical protein
MRSSVRSEAAGVERCHIDDGAERDDLAFDVLGYELQPVMCANAQRLRTDPKYPGVHPIRFNWRIHLIRRDVTAFNKNVIAQVDADRFSRRSGFGRRRWPTLDRRHPRRFVVRREKQLIAHPQRPGLNSSHKDTSILHAINILNRKTQRLLRIRLSCLQLVDRLKQARPLEPRDGRIAVAHNIYPGAGRDRYERARFQPERLQGLSIHFLDFPERGLRVVGEIHLVYGHNYLANPKQAEQLSMAAALLTCALVGGDHHDTGSGAGSAGDHVL